MKLLARITVLVAFLFASGGQWYVLQGIAWASMVVEFHETYSLQKSVVMTLSGQYPCAICKMIAEHKQDETMKLVPLEKMHKSFLVTERIEVSPIALLVSPTFSASSLVFALDSISQGPLTPPPRLVS